MSKERYSNLELYRIILMLLIVAHHYVVNSGLMDTISHNPTLDKSIYLYLFGMWGKTAINCFVLITGYFMCKSNITLRKFSKLLLWITFYDIAIYIIFVGFGYSNFSIRTFIRTSLPFKNITDDFTSSFIIFYLFIPFMNTLIKNLKKKQHGLLILLCLFIYTIWAQIPYFYVGSNYVIWFSILYLISSYIRIYNWGGNINCIKWGIYSSLSIIISMISVYLLIGTNHFVYYFVSDSNAILAVTTSVSTFMFFKKLPIKYHSWINKIGSTTFGVLLIHANSDTMRQWLWKDTLNNTGHFYDNIYLHSIVCVLGIFVVCTIIDQIRLYFIEKPLFKYLDRKMEKRNNMFLFRWT